MLDAVTASQAQEIAVIAQRFPACLLYIANAPQGAVVVEVVPPGEIEGPTTLVRPRP